MSRDLEVSEDKFIKITYSALVYFLIGATGFAAWMTAIQIGTAANADSLVRAEGQQVEIEKTLISIDKRTARMEIMIEQYFKPKKGE